ncbi:MAG: hypothetical protein V7K88_21405 [Nostoc sp.]|uniref:hypothetical protein n=1 Tax=Nostoc sp. TaxID=1180 RepID=UPI002FFB6A45
MSQVLTAGFPTCTPTEKQATLLRSGILRQALASGNVIRGDAVRVRSLASQMLTDSLTSVGAASLRVAMPQALRCATLASGIEGKI